MLFVCILAVQPFAHPGDLQNDGTPEQGHYDRTTGEYHYHHSNIHEGACQYPADECPLNTENKTASVAESEEGKQNINEFGSTDRESYITSKATSGIPNILAQVIIFSIVYLMPVAILLYLIAFAVKEKRKSPQKAVKCGQATSLYDTVKPAAKHIQNEKTEKLIVDNHEPEEASQERTQKPGSKRVKMVYYTPRGNSFHRIKSCPKLARSKNINKAPFDDMKWKLLPCETCYKNHWKYM